MLLCRYALTSNPGHSQFLVISRLISFLSSTPQIACISGCTSEVLQTIERASLFKKGVEYPFRFNALFLPKLMHQLKGRVCGRIYFYAHLKYLTAFLNNSLDQPWMASFPELTKVWADEIVLTWFHFICRGYTILVPFRP